MSNPWEKALLTAGMPKEDAIKAIIVSKQVESKASCPRCRSEMQLVTLVTPKRRAYFCSKDNVVIPIPIEN
jgi:hypothetical protein